MSDPSRPGSGAMALRGARDALTLPAWVVGFALIGVGSLARDVGHPVGAAILSTVLMWAGPAQVIFYGGLAAGSALPALAVAVCLSSIRFLPMTMSILPLLRTPGQGIGTRLMAAHFIAVTVWVESLRRLPDLAPRQRVAYYFGFANTCLWLSAILTGVGYYLSNALPLPLAAALLFITPIFFTISLVAGARHRQDWFALGLGFALAPAFSYLAGNDLDLLLTGIVGGTAAYLLGRARRRS